MAKTKQPTGLAITRNGSTFYFTWKQASKYSAQELYYGTNGKYPTKLATVAKGATSASVTIAISGSYTSVNFKIRGKKGKKWSEWSAKSYSVYKPNKPSISSSLDSDTPDKCYFSWTINASSDSSAIFYQYEWQSKLVAGSSSSGPAQSWSNPSTGSGSSVDSYSTQTEDTSSWNTTNYSYTRWFRIRSKGPAGNSDWAYAYHTYANPNQISNTKAKYESRNGSGYSVIAEWTTSSSFSKPVDNVVVEYATGVPSSSSATSSNVKKTTLAVPSSVSWSTVQTLSDVTSKGALTFSSGTDLSADNAVFVRINTVHDEVTTEGTGVIVSDSLRVLSKPTSVSITNLNTTTRRCTLSATNNCAITDSFLAVYFRTTSEPDKTDVIGIIPAGSSSINALQLPEWVTGDSFSIGVKALIADYTPVSALSTGVTYYTITNERASSNIVWTDGVPLPPSNITLSKVSDGTIQVGWDWTWTEATEAELSWADHKDAWESTSEPTTYIVNNTNASRWNISGLSIGTWYIRIRLIKVDGDAVIYGAYSDIQEYKLSSSPDIPALVVSPNAITKDGSVTCYWAYVSTDGTAQMQAEITEAFIDDETGAITYTTPAIATTSTAQHLTLNAEEYGWNPGEKHYLVARVTSASGERSDGWSTPVPVTIVDPIAATITATSLTETTITLDDDSTKTVLSLTELPLTVTVTGAGVGGTTRVIIERNLDYHMERPDGREDDGFAGETIAIKSQTTEDQMSFNVSDLIGALDDGASYKIIATVIDSYGQTAEASINFEVHWTHQAVMPSATVVTDQDNNIVMITPVQPTSGYASGDTCDIYRLSVDKPELIVQNAVFGTKYVDPYPTLGDFGGHRIVYKTKTGDYITEDNMPAWVDYTKDQGDTITRFGTIIDFGGEQLILPYNNSISNSWKKDFTETHYLGGSVKGDWNPGVSRTASGTMTIPVEYDPDKIEALRRLAIYSGICHVRTPDGSSYAANVDVRDNREEKWTRRLSKVTLDIIRVDPEGFDGVTYEDWIAGDDEIEG